jgi:hypothetical protein
MEEMILLVEEHGYLLLFAIGFLEATAYTGIGWVFSAQVELILSWGGRFASWILGGAALLVVAAGAWRVAKVRMHRVMHRREKEPEALAPPGGSRCRVISGKLAGSAVPVHLPPCPEGYSTWNSSP